MKFLNITFYFFVIYFINLSLYANNIATINFDYIMSKSNDYNNFLEKLISFKQLNQIDFTNEELFISTNKKDIGKLKDIINDNEFLEKVDQYNLRLNKFTKDVSDFNYLIDKNIEINKKKIYDKVIVILQIISNNDNYDIILNNDNYIISSKKNDISDKVIDLLNGEVVILDLITKID